MSSFEVPRRPRETGAGIARGLATIFFGLAKRKHRIRLEQATAEEARREALVKERERAVKRGEQISEDREKLRSDFAEAREGFFKRHQRRPDEGSLIPGQTTATRTTDRVAQRGIGSKLVSSAGEGGGPRTGTSKGERALDDMLAAFEGVNTLSEMSDTFLTESFKASLRDTGIKRMSDEGFLDVVEAAHKRLGIEGFLASHEYRVKLDEILRNSLSELGLEPPKTIEEAQAQSRSFLERLGDLVSPFRDKSGREPVDFGSSLDTPR